MKAELNFHDVRAKKARFGRLILRDSHQTIIRVMLVLFAIASVGGIAIGNPAGWVAASVLSFLTVINLWAYGELRNLEAHLPAEKPQTLLLHKALDRRVLGRMKKADSPRDIWQAVRGIWRQRFFSVRYGLGYDLFDHGIPDDPSLTPKVWDAAFELAHREGQNSITGATLTVALLKVIPDYEDYLAQLHLDIEDLDIGVDWQRHVEIVAERQRERNSFGGIARDWAAGYTPILNQLGHNMTLDVQRGGFLHREIESNKKIVDQAIQTLSGASRANVALVGDTGVGKTTMVYSLAQRLSTDPKAPQSIRYHQVVEIDAPTILAQVSDAATLESIMIGILAEVRAAKNVILFLDQAHLFFQSGSGSIDLSNVLTPVLKGDSIRIIMAMENNEWQRLRAKNSTLASLINYQAVAPADEENTMRIMQDQILLIEGKHHVTFMYQSLLEAYRLADRYVHDTFFPGKAIRVLEGSVNRSENGLVTERSVQESLETTLGVKIKGASKEEKSQLLNLEEEIHKRMVNQARAVKVVSDALRRARSGVSNPDKPIGTFMFLGPTGVGKTELAKTLSEVYFGGDGQIVRVDMNEYLNSSDVNRLLAPGSEKGTSLLAEIKKQPFSVVLFDEIEKAHPDVVNVFLQLLDEGVIRDSENKQVSFKDAIVIATSNAGADRIRKQIESGHELEQFEVDFVDKLIESGDFKPEFLNRFDEIVLFRPLKAEELMQIVDIMIASVNKTLSRQKIKVELDESAKKWLVANGNDPRLGARPLRRMVQRSVENIVAKKLLSEHIKSGSVVALTEADLAASQD